MTYKRHQKMFELFRTFEHKDEILYDRVLGQWRSIGADQLVQDSLDLAYGFVDRGLKKGDHVVLMCSNRIEWALVDFALMKGCMVNTPIYTNFSIEDILYIISDCKASMVIIEDQDMLRALKSKLDGKKDLPLLVSVDPMDGEISISTLLEQGKQHPQSSELKHAQTLTSSQDLFTTIYTSGTTGRPKGVLLTHENIISQLDYVKNYFPVLPGENSLSFLPLCHSFQRIVDYYLLVLGAKIFYTKSDTLAQDMKDLNPVILVAVPKLVSRILAAIEDKIEAAGGLSTHIGRAAVRFAEKRGEGKQQWFESLRFKIFQRLVYKKWENALGGRLKYLIIGAAALPLRASKIMKGAEIPIFEGYGLSEAAPVIAFNFPGTSRIGSVGKVMNIGEIRLTDEDEILYKGPNVMLGYLNNTEDTQGTLRDGWLYTGDIGRVDEEGFLYIVDRKKQIFKLSNGKYIAPQVLEKQILEIEDVENVLICTRDGDRITAMLQISEDLLVRYQSEPKQVEQELKQAIDEKLNHLPKHQWVKYIEVDTDPWTVENGCLTPTLKIKRAAIMKRK